MNGELQLEQQSGRGNMAVGCFALLLIATLTYANGDQTFPLLMPMAHPAQEEAYICTPIRLSDTQTFYVTGFTPNATAHTAHHMLVSPSLKTYIFQPFDLDLELEHRSMVVMSLDRKSPFGIVVKWPKQSQAWKFISHANLATKLSMLGPWMRLS